MQRLDLEMIKKIFLQKGKDIPVRRFHPWVFSGAIAQTNTKLQDGDQVQVLDHQENYLATGHYHNGNIAVRLFCFEEIEINADFWSHRLRAALAVRQSLGFTDTNCYRLVHGEGDGCSGLVIDWYNGVAVFQAHSIGMHLAQAQIVAALQEIYGEQLRAVYDKSAETLPEQYAKTIRNSYVFGQAQVPHAVLENGHTFMIDWETGQKTGFFLDQRDNRALLARYSKGKNVLNAFCYSGGFSVYALGAGAQNVDSIDASQKAIDLTIKNIEANHLTDTSTHNIADDVMRYFKNDDTVYDVMVLDPPAFAKSLSARHRAVQGYKRLNVEGLKRLAPGGILFTFSCSQVVDRELFYNTVVAAAMEVGRQVRVLHQLTQPADHPINVFHPESNYLKGLVLYVE